MIFRFGCRGFSLSIIIADTQAIIARNQIKIEMAAARIFGARTVVCASAVTGSKAAPTGEYSSLTPWAGWSVRASNGPVTLTGIEVITVRKIRKATTAGKIIRLAGVSSQGKNHDFPKFTAKIFL
jgi:hypothetical protein